MEASLANIVAQKSLKWVFVGGKGGVGKTTSSCSLGVALARARRSVLIVSTDPAHNLSDAFNQKFSRVPTAVRGFDNLYCMEIDAAAAMAEGTALAEAEAAAAEGGDGDGSAAGGGAQSMMASLMKEFSNAVPGIDEAMSFMELMKHTKAMEFEVTVFDTAPTGHTLRLLALPGTLDRAMAKLVELRDRFGGMLTAVQGMMGAAGMGAGGGAAPVDAIFAKLEEIRGQVGEVQKRLRDPDETTFVCVCIPEFLSLYETERLVQELTRYEIDVHNIIVNQVLFVAPDSTCKRCLARTRMQGKYLAQIADLYGDDFNVVRTPLLDEEVRGAPKLRAFSTFLTTPYALSTPLPPELEEGGGGGGAC